MKKLPITEIWKKETNLAKWLAENIDILNKELDTEISVEEILDDTNILAIDDYVREYVIVQSQFNETTNENLSKLITYGAAYNAKTLIWIAEKIQDEHIKAVEWIKKNSLNTINIFLIQIEFVISDEGHFISKFKCL